MREEYDFLQDRINMLTDKKNVLIEKYNELRKENEELQKKLEGQVEKVYDWACDKTGGDCEECKYSTRLGWEDYSCPFDDVITAIEDKAKEQGEG